MFITHADLNHGAPKLEYSKIQACIVPLFTTRFD
jgi:hypothetical protein